MIDILVVDDQTLVHKTIKNYLAAEPDLNIIGFARNGKAAVERVATLHPDVVLMDVEMPVMDGLTATKIIAKKFTRTKILILTIEIEKEQLNRALQSGAKGYWLKSTTAKELANAIRQVHQGCFQLTLELIDKYRLDTTFFDSKSEKAELSKLDILETIAKLESKVDDLRELTPSKINATVEKIIRRRIEQRNEHNTNLQYRLDRMQQRLTRLEKNLSLFAKIQLTCNFILAAYLVLSYLILRQ